MKVYLFLSIPSFFQFLLGKAYTYFLSSSPRHLAAKILFGITKELTLASCIVAPVGVNAGESQFHPVVASVEVCLCVGCVCVCALVSCCRRFTKYCDFG